MQVLLTKNSDEFSYNKNNLPKVKECFRVESILISVSVLHKLTVGVTKLGKTFCFDDKFLRLFVISNSLIAHLIPTDLSTINISNSIKKIMSFIYYNYVVL